MAMTVPPTYDVDTNDGHHVEESYRTSLPPLLQAAANGDYLTLEQLVQGVAQDNGTLWNLLHTKDRHNSTAEHWAAGGGHIKCLQYLVELRKGHTVQMDQHHQNNRLLRKDRQQQPVKMRRRDGKTSLHYAARNGHLNCIQYLLQEQEWDVDETSGEGTTPLHMACYGGHLHVVQHLHEQYGANLLAVNEWNCSMAHFVGLTIASSTREVFDLCNYLQQHGISFCTVQNQGHTALHKAAQRRNRHVIQWMAMPKREGGAGLSSCQLDQAGRPDIGGHKPSEIWQSAGGDDAFASWMQTLGW